MIVVPMGSQYISESQIQLDRKCVCEHCGKAFNYRYKLRGTGAANSFLWLQNEAAGRNAVGSASEAIRKQLTDAFLPFPCPFCGKFQAGMVRYFRKKKLESLLIFAIFCGILFLLISSIWALNTGIMELAHSTVFWGFASVLLGGNALIYLVRKLSKPKQSSIAFDSTLALALEPDSIAPVPISEVPADIQQLIPEFYTSRNYGRAALFTAILPPISLVLIILSIVSFARARSVFRLHPAYCPIPEKSGLTYSIISLCIVAGVSTLVVGALLAP